MINGREGMTIAILTETGDFASAIKNAKVINESCSCSLMVFKHHAVRKNQSSASRVDKLRNDELCTRKMFQKSKIVISTDQERT